ncbi:MAG TPA: hypothetical protein VFQ51_11350 [Vicinamibacteria bacterium]|nr:hypothetical protein [Vicinamibacteria bacterium]
MRSHRAWAGVALALSFAAAAAAEDVTIVYNLTENGQPKGTATQYVSSEKLRMSNPDGDVIMEYGTGRLVSIDHKKKEYWETTRDEMTAQLAKMNAQMEEQQKKMQESMQNLPPAMREKMGNMMGGIMAQVTVTPGTGTKKVAGYDTKPYTIALGEMMKQETWNTESIPFPAPAIDARNSMMTLNNPMMKGAKDLAEKMKQVKGIPLSETTTVKILTKTTTTTREATSVKTGPIDPSAFALPAGYKKVESPLAKMAKPAK